MVQVLLTSFEPFGGRHVNASALLAEAAMARLPGALRARVAHVVLPVDHAAAARRIRALVAALGPSRVVLTGEWSGPRLRLERHGRPGPLAPWRGGVTTPLPGPLTRPFRRRGLAVALSPDAGRYVCDTTFWAAAGALRAPGREALFVHVPRDAVRPAVHPGRAIVAGLVDLVAGDAAVGRDGPGGRERSPLRVAGRRGSAPLPRAGRRR